MSEATRARLVELVAEGEGMDLAEANLMIASEGTPALDIASALAHVEALAELARESGVVPALREQGFRGDRETYDDPRNSFLNEVLERRRGLPIALATLTLAVADRTGEPMAGIGLPGHFVVAELGGESPVYRDPFDGWRILTPSGLAMIAERSAGVRLTPELLAPVPARAILTRTLANLRASYMRRRRLADALWTVELALIVEPGEGRMLREAVRLLAATGRYEEAQTAAEALLAGDPDDLARADLEDQLTALAELRGRVN